MTCESFLSAKEVNQVLLPLKNKFWNNILKQK